MGLIDGIVYETNYFISVYEALGLVADHTNESLEDVAIYLDSYWLSVFVPVYEKNAMYLYKCIDHQKYNDFKKTQVFESTYVILQEMAEIKAIEDDETATFSAYADFRDKYANYFWLRYDFFNNEGVKRLGITDDLADLQTDNIYLEERKAEAERIRQVWQMRKEHEQQAYAHKETTSNKSKEKSEPIQQYENDLTNVDHPNYAPDLHVALQLWTAFNECQNPHSYSDFANKWLSKRYPNYPESAKTRIREIASPLKNWSSQRNYNKKD